MQNEFTPTIKVENVTPGMVLDFDSRLVFDSNENGIFLGEAEVISVTPSEGSELGFDFWVSPEDGVTPEVHVRVFESQSLKIVG